MEVFERRASLLSWIFSVALIVRFEFDFCNFSFTLSSSQSVVSTLLFKTLSSIFARLACVLISGFSIRISCTTGRYSGALNPDSIEDLTWPPSDSDIPNKVSSLRLVFEWRTTLFTSDKTLSIDLIYRCVCSIVTGSSVLATMSRRYFTRVCKCLETNPSKVI